MISNNWINYKKNMSNLILYKGLDSKSVLNPDIDQYEDSGKFLFNNSKEHYELLLQILQ